MEWKPIETAPKDGSTLFLHSSKPDDHGYPWGVLMGGWDGDKWDLSHWKGASSDGFEPEHWMPLPAPPTDSTK